MYFVLSQKLKGILWMLFHCLNLSILSVMVRFCTEEGLPIFEIFFLSTLISFLCMLVWAIYTRGRSLRVRRPTFYLYRALLSTAAMILWFFTLKLIPLTEATAISFTSPLFGAITGMVLFERLNWRRLIAIVVGFLGVMIIIRPGIEIVQWGAVLGILASLLWAMVDILTKVQTRSELLTTDTFYITFAMALLSFPMGITVWLTPSLDQWLSIVILGATFWINFFAIFQAYRFADLSLLLPIDFSRLLLTLVLAYFFFGEVMDVWTGVGGLSILSSAVYFAHEEAKSIKG